MKKSYKALPLDKAYRLLNTGAVGIICTYSSEKGYNMAPAAWLTPIEYDPVTRVLIVLDREHKTSKNILQNGEFAIAVPHIQQVDMVKKLGSTSGKECNKIERFKIDVLPAEKINVQLPNYCIGYLECKLYKTIDEESVYLFLANVINALVDSTAFERRLLSETFKGKTIHHLGGKQFITTGNEIF